MSKNLPAIQIEIPDNSPILKLVSKHTGKEESQITDQDLAAFISTLAISAIDKHLVEIESLN